MQARGEKITVKLVMNATMLPDAPSRNVVAEIVGSEKPNEVIVLGGHIDSWDVGQGAMDDGGGSVAAWEAVRLMKALGLKPKRTVRVVLWTNEENGGRGGLGYRDAHEKDLANHILAMESDNGVFMPRGVRVAGSAGTLAAVKQIAALLRRIGADSAALGGGEADIEPLMDRGVPGLSLDVDGSKYFWYHHTNADMMEAVNPNEMARCVAVMAVMAYVVADMPETLPRGTVKP
jgi:carboxypeptidase Q